MSRIVYTLLVVLLAPVWLPIMLLMAAMYVADEALDMLIEALGT